MVYAFLPILDTDPCNPDPCQNGAKCSMENNKFKCTCTDGYAGNRCEYGQFKYHLMNEM